jgi:DNA topoisomerase-1
MKVVVVESPAKAKTINKYLGKDYTVLASYGHIRDLPAKDGSVRPDADFAMDWELDPKSEKQVREIAKALKDADGLILATDPDREGEAISWHVQKVLEDRKLLVGKDVKRVVFNEITKSAILEAMRNPREVNQELVDAYLARRALDYLVGFTLSPVLWRKLPGSRSAGRVQSVALRLICERESEIERFRSQEYWTIAADFQTPRGAMMTANLTYLDGRKLDKMDLPNEAAAQAARSAIEAASFSVASIERKQTRRHPFAPFTTSTLQQEASRKLHLGAARTMQIAQRLYEGVDLGGETLGLITYMRTDGVQMAAEAVAACRSLISSEFGPNYVPAAPRLYKTKAKNAQEAHEAIRPTDVSRRPQDVARFLDRDQLRLYELIWKRTMASQMESAVLDQVAVDIASQDRKIQFRANGSVVVFDGFLKLYREDRDDEADSEEEGRILPAVNDNEPMQRKALRPEQHFTQPPPRFSEASLVKKLEELGIGRPSTYASIISVLQDREYVRLDNRRFIPEDRGRLVTAFLENFFRRYVEYNFTADLENQLDEVSGGQIDWRAVLRKFWESFSVAVADTKELRVSDVLTALDLELGPHFFPGDGTDHDPRLCPTCNSGRLSLKLGKFGAFIGCANYPECRYTRPLAVATQDGSGDADVAPDGPKLLGADPGTGLPVSLRRGPYGVYVQLGEDDKVNKPKRVSLYRDLKPADVDLAIGLKLLALPRSLGHHPESGEEIQAGVGKFGPYLKHGSAYKSLGRDDDVLSIGMNRAVEVLAQASPGRKGSDKPPRSLGEHPADAKPVNVQSGRYGPYVSHGKIYATLPKGMSMDEITLEEAVALLSAKAGKGGTGRKVAAKKPAKVAAAATDGETKPKISAAKKPAAKKATTKKPATKKAVAKKPVAKTDAPAAATEAAPKKKRAAG